MSYDHDLLAQVRAEWRHAGRSPQARAACRHLARAHPELRLEGCADLADVVGLCEPRGGRTVLERAALVRALLEEAGDRAVQRALLQTLLPGLVSVCRQLRFGEGIVDSPGETVAAAVSLLGELVIDWAGQSRPYAAPDLLSALRGRLRRWLLKEKAAAQQGRLDLEPAAPEGSALLTRLEDLAKGQHARLARLTYARVFEGRSLRDLAAADHSHPLSLQGELRQFAQHHLL
jgi:hypothetical protein